tara:strand:- start:61 stop:291 length:231 start_codon:yes stop_codon:yes gene_type:complete
MTKLEETIGFLEMLKGLNKTVIEIDSIMHRLTEMQEEAINYTHSCKSDSEQLSKRPSTSSTWECFSKADKQKKGNV